MPAVWYGALYEAIDPAGGGRGLVGVNGPNFM